MMFDRGSQAVGIDLGTTYSSLAFLDGQMTPRMVPDSSGKPVIPSVTYFDESGEIVVGELALEQARVAAERVVQFVKVHMGDEWRTEIAGHVHTPESLSAIILSHLISEAEPQIGGIERAVIAVPAYFTEKRRRATEQAGQIAGLDVIGTLNEPMAATLAYGLYLDDKEQDVLVYDLGGGTFDVTIVRISPGRIEEIATNGNRQLGGRDWDARLIDFVAEEFSQAHGRDPRHDLQAAQDLQLECERAKRRLGRMAKTAIRLHAFGSDHVTEITRDQFEAMTQPLVQSTKLTTELVLEDAHLDWSDLTRIALVGGSTQLPAVRAMLREASGLQPDTGVNPVIAVALGAAIYAHMLESGSEVHTIRRPPEDEVPSAQDEQHAGPSAEANNASASDESAPATPSRGGRVGK
jgi:molecular chaperone DnaK